MDVHASSGFVPVNNNDVVALRASQTVDLLVLTVITLYYVNSSQTSN